MNGWLLTIIGVVFLGVMIDLIYPNGKTNTFCKGIFGIFVVFVLVSPVLKFNENKFKENYIDDVAISNIINLRENSFKTQIESVLQNLGLSYVDVEIDGKMLNNEFIIENIFVDITNMVLSENKMNINKYEVITCEIQKITNIEKSRIIFYG